MQGSPSFSPFAVPSTRSTMAFLPGGAQMPEVTGNGHTCRGSVLHGKLFVGGLSCDTTEQELTQYFSKWGTVVDCAVIRDVQTQLSRGFAFVTFATASMAVAALNARPHIINNRVRSPSLSFYNMSLEFTLRKLLLFSSLEGGRDLSGKMDFIHLNHPHPKKRSWHLHSCHRPAFLQREPRPGCELSLSVVLQIEMMTSPRGSGFVIFEEEHAVERCLGHGSVHVIEGGECIVARSAFEHQLIEAQDNFDKEGRVEKKVDITTADPPDLTASANAPITEHAIASNNEEICLEYKSADSMNEASPIMSLKGCFGQSTPIKQSAEKAEMK
ncbi:unnamed protein product [Toxocara canis]|uniref:RRM domain-containing protein n=1 Tax=Toxocara canis TaxID=6265 RepID=A0A183UJ74_TOXCA|nr:unnamed protein product [Toxocara canis]